MYRAAIRSAARTARSAPLSNHSRRYISFKPSEKPRTWKGAAVRWGLAFGALYWYNTSPIFADEPIPQPIASPPQLHDVDLPTVESVIEQKRKEAEARALEQAQRAPAATEEADAAIVSKEQPQGSVSEGESDVASTPAGLGSPEALEEEAGQQGAFNPETGEINWDCPCLGGMADGPCGEEFKSAFSCFVYSTEEPKGMDCIEKFQGMQDCFRKYPEIYGAELADADAESEDDATPVPEANGEVNAPSAEGKVEHSALKPSTEVKSPLDLADSETKTALAGEPEEAVAPKQAVDATDANVKAEEQKQ